ncbi:hypothetical protein [Humibacillus sp. DSM 29435]|uniref:hypothetical protein n=1 Tax=Humibacillus sp. DSM 29435 TaxID=1869167 RepID=UPI000ABF29AD|nr:hypothetical protein [Humibacillus sp. DSM 29435]
MNKLVTGASALALCAALAACGGASDPVSPSTTAAASLPSSSPAGTSSTPATPGPEGATSSGPSSTASTSSGSSTKSSTSTAPPVTIDQSTPEGAMAAWLGSMVSGDSTAVCGLMASGGKPITEIEGAGATCSKMIAPTVTELKKVGGAFAGLRITGASVKGNQATFEKASTQPVLAAKVISGLKAVKVGSKWYVTP